MFFLTKFAENAVILILLTLIPSLSPVYWSRVQKIFYAPPWLLRIAAITGHSP